MCNPDEMFIASWYLASTKSFEAQFVLVRSTLLNPGFPF
jgi:hypothetical protein